MARRSPADDTTRAKLLDAAEKVFAEHGFGGASVRMINAAAKVDSGAIHYHFGSKDDLFRAVIKRRGEVMSADRLDRLARCPAGDVAQIVAAYIQPYANPALGSRDERLRFARLRAWLMAEQGDPSPLGEEHKQTGQKFLTALATALPHLSLNEVRTRYLIMWSALNTLSAGQGHAALEQPGSRDALLEFERSVPELVSLFAQMFLAPTATGAHVAERKNAKAAGRPKLGAAGRPKRGASRP